ncbi:MAG: hypothetical protein PHW76_01980 [Alphaproteobacteria bacterium]|nr:hypothetical protein [Alphaproteobacteria bacterium]
MEELTFNDCLVLMRRWKTLFMRTTLTAWAFFAVFVLSWSNYRATATVQIEQPKISAEAIAQREALADRRISMLQQKVLSTSSLAGIITKFDLYPGRAKAAPTFVARNMADKIKLDLVRGSVAHPSAAKEAISAIAFILSFDYSDPLKAQQVMDELVSRFIDEDLKQRQTEAEETSAFLGKQIEGLEKSLNEQEKNIADFQKEQGVTRPENLAFNQQIVAQLILNMQNLDSRIAANEGSLGVLRGQLAAIDPYSRLLVNGQVLTTPSVQLKALQSEYASLTSQYGPNHPDVLKIRRKMEGIKAQGVQTLPLAAELKSQIIDARAKLEEAEKNYGSEHPDVASLKAKLQRLEFQLAQQREPTNNFGIVPDADNPVYLQFAAQMRSSEEQRKALLRQRSELQAQIDKYQKALIQNPEAQQKLASLTRDYENAQIRYRELKAKQLVADMSEQMQKDQRGGNLTLINPPELPIKTSPSRSVLALGGLMASIVLGLAAVTAAQVVSGGLVGLHVVETVVGAEPLVAIPHIRTREEYERSWRARLKRQEILLAKRFAPYCERIRKRIEELVKKRSRRRA